MASHGERPAGKKEGDGLVKGEGQSAPLNSIVSFFVGGQHILPLLGGVGVGVHTIGLGYNKPRAPASTSAKRRFRYATDLLIRRFLSRCRGVRHLVLTPRLVRELDIWC